MSEMAYIMRFDCRKGGPKDWDIWTGASWEATTSGCRLLVFPSAEARKICAPRFDPPYQYIHHREGLDIPDKRYRIEVKPGEFYRQGTGGAFRTTTRVSDGTCFESDVAAKQAMQLLTALPYGYSPTLWTEYAYDMEDTVPDTKPSVYPPQICKRCNEKNDWAEPNQKDGAFVCWSCRGRR